MIAEGSGCVAPRQIPVNMTLSEQLIVLEIARARAEHRAYKARRDQWGQGIKGAIAILGLGTLERDLRPIYSGCLGEYAMQRYLEARFPGKVTIDWRLTKYGDFGIDITCFGFKMQVKTRQFKTNSSLVRRTNNRKVVSKIIPVHGFTFCEWDQRSTIHLVGWCWADLVRDKPLVSSVGEWLNAEIKDEELLPVSRMCDELEAWREARQC